VIAVSGGADSVCIGHILCSLRHELNLEIVIAHLNHLIRGEDAEADSNYVSSLAKDWGVVFESGQADVNEMRLAHKLTLEEAAREARYDFLARVAQKHSMGYVITGHTMNDHLETILLHVIRGCGLRGLEGLRPVMSRTIRGKEIKVIRPILNITRSDTENYCRSHNLKPRSDKTNFEPFTTRNRIRLHALPVLEQYVPNALSGLSELAKAAGQTMAVVDSEVMLLASQSVMAEENSIIIEKKYLKNTSTTLLRYFWVHCLERLCGYSHDIESTHIESILELVEKSAGRRLDLPHGLLLVSEYAHFWLGSRKDAKAYPFGAFGPSQLELYKKTEIAGWTVEMDIVFALEESNDPLEAFFDYQAMGNDIYVRGWRRGDSFLPLGLGGTKKVGRFFCDAHIPQSMRGRIPIVVAGDKIAWLVGYRIDNRFKVTESTKSVLRLRFRKHDSNNVKP